MITRNTTLLNFNDKNKFTWLAQHETEHQQIFNYLNSLSASPAPAPAPAVSKNLTVETLTVTKSISANTIQGSTVDPTNILYYNADPTGTNDSTSAIQQCINAGLGRVYIPAGNYLVNGNLTIPDNIKMVSDQTGILKIANPIVIGNTAMLSTNLDIDVNIVPQSTFPSGSSMIICNNIGNSKFNLRLMGDASTANFLEIHSLNGVGSFDNIIHLSTSNYFCNSGISLINGNSAIASVAGDFINGNYFLKCDMAINTTGILWYSIGTATGSVDAPISHNLFERCDINSYASYALAPAQGVNFSYNTFINCTFESATAVHDVNLNNNTNGNYFYNTTAKVYGSQILNPLDVWINGINDGANFSNIKTNSIAGRTSGTIEYSFPEISSGYKKVFIHFNNYENNTTTSDTVVLPWNWVMPLYSLIVNNNGALAPTLSVNSVSFDPNNSTVYTGSLTIEGY